MVAEAGLEPALLYRKRILSPQRLPIPPLGLIELTKKSFNFCVCIFHGI